MCRATACVRARQETLQRVAVHSPPCTQLLLQGNHRVRHVSAAGTIVTIVGNGVDGFGGDGGPASAASLSWPNDMALDGTGGYYIADK